MKKILVLALTMTMLGAKAQLLVNLQMPASGVVQKSQLWTMTLTNTGNANLVLHIEFMLSDAVGGMQVMSGVTQTITIPPGTLQLSSAVVQPMQYTILSTSHAVDASPNGLLPVGNFDVCYSFMKHAGDYVEKITEECQELLIQPLSPPQLVYPYDGSFIETTSPQLSWLAPMPVSLFTNLTYDVDVVELLVGQTPEDAIQQNLPLFHSQHVRATTLAYPASAPALMIGKLYAWRIIAKSNEEKIAASETWLFTPKNYDRIDSIMVGEQPYAKLQREEGGGYALFTGQLKFDYLNESADSIWNLTVVDLSTPDKKEQKLAMDSLPLKPGQNLIRYDVNDNSGFIDKHLYLLEVLNSRNESWRLYFEYRKRKE